MLVHFVSFNVEQSQCLWDFFSTLILFRSWELLDLMKNFDVFSLSSEACSSSRVSQNSSLLHVCIKIEMIKWIKFTFDLNKSRQKFHHSLKEHHKISDIPKFRCEML